MKGEMLAGVICGVLFGLLLVVVMMCISSKNRSIKCVYDERQQIVRGKGYRYGFFTLLVYDILYAFTDMLFETRFVDSMAGIFPGVALGALVCASYCIWNEGYVSMNEQPTRLTVVLFSVGILNVLVSVPVLIHGEMIVDGVLTFRCANLVCGAVTFAVAGQLMLKRFLDKRDGKEEEADDD